MSLFNAFNDTIFLKEKSSLKEQYEALSKLKEEYPNNKDINSALYICKKGLDGEKEIEYELSKANLGLYVLHDINFEYEDLKAHIVISKAYTYFIECKNLVGNIIVNNKGEFIREYNIYGRKIKKGMYSPLRQVEAQRDVYKKIWYKSLDGSILDKIKRAMAEKNFEFYNKAIVVASNHETILNTRFAPKDIKNRVIKVENLVRKLQEDLEKADKDILWSKKVMYEQANKYLKNNIDRKIDYYEVYKKKYIK